MMGPPPGGPPLPQMSLGKGKNKAKKVLPKIIDDNNGKNILKVGINKIYQLYFMTTNMLKSFAWFGSCISFMYLFPMAIEYMSEQNRIMAKI